MKWFDEFSLIVFTVEYIARLICGGLRPQFIGKRFATLRYALTPMALSASFLFSLSLINTLVPPPTPITN